MSSTTRTPKEYMSVRRNTSTQARRDSNPGSQRDVLENQHDLGENQHPDDHHRQPVKGNLVFGEEQFLERHQGAYPTTEIKTGQCQGFDLLFEFLLQAHGAV